MGHILKLEDLQEKNEEKQSEFVPSAASPDGRRKNTGIEMHVNVNIAALKLFSRATLCITCRKPHIIDDSGQLNNL